MDNELRIRNFIINIDEPFDLAQLIVLFREKGGTDDRMVLKVVSTLLDEDELIYSEITKNEDGYPTRAYLTRKCVEKLNNNKYTR